MNVDRLMLLASNAGDVPVLSALVQDAIVRAGDIAWDGRRRRLVLLASRYRWEARQKLRVRTALRIEAVLAVQRQSWPQDENAPLALLTVNAEGDFITMIFAGGVSLRAKVECIDAVLEDMPPGWDVRHRPEHG